MIKTEDYGKRFDGIDLIRTYSDIDMMIQQDGTGNLYSEAIDPVTMGRTYTETDIPIEREAEDAETEEQGDDEN